MKLKKLEKYLIQRNRMFLAEFDAFSWMITTKFKMKSTLKLTKHKDIIEFNNNSQR